MPVDVERQASDVRDGIRSWLAIQLKPATDLRVSELSSTDGGLSSEMYFFSATWRDGEGARRQQDFVIRIRPDFHQVIPDPDAIFQYELMKAIGERSTVPVPRVWFAEPGTTTIGSPFFVMERVPGLLFQPGGGIDWTPEQLATLYDNGLAMLADLHRIDPTNGFDFVGWPGATALDGVLAQATRWYTWTKAGRDLGILDVAYEWVKANQPDTTDSSVCWGDARPGNILVNDDLSLAAVLDWEMAVLAPPEADLGWWLLFERAAYEGFGLPKPAGVPSRAETIATYERHLGRSARDVRYYEILAGLRLGIISVRLLDLNGYGELGAPWTLEETPTQKIVNCPFTRILAEWLGRDVYGRLLG
jgi:aminoglycoside phosphotransferase (APT) family kinase protein